MNWDIIVNFICVAAHSVRTMVLGIYCSKVMLLMPDAYGRSILLNQGWKKTSLNSDITGQARQEWDYQNTTNNYYTPLFVDLVDDYNQGVGYPSRCYDQIKMPQFVVNLFGAYRTWNDFESALRKYTGSYFTENQINEFLFYERSWLQRNGYI